MKRMVCLLIDNNPNDHEIFTSALNDVIPITKCIIALNAIDALQIIKRNKILPDYIFMNISLSSLNECELIQEIKKDKYLKDITIVVHSTSAKPMEMESAIKWGAFGIHMKDYDYPRVCEMISKYIPLLKS